ncbi:hypothetical protein SK128_027698, partial [Halocaridina rubra]
EVTWAKLYTYGRCGLSRLLALTNSVLTPEYMWCSLPYSWPFLYVRCFILYNYFER